MYRYPAAASYMRWQRMRQDTARHSRVCWTDTSSKSSDKGTSTSSMPIRQAQSLVRMGFSLYLHLSRLTWITALQEGISQIEECPLFVFGSDLACKEHKRQTCSPAKVMHSLPLFFDFCCLYHERKCLSLYRKLSENRFLKSNVLLVRAQTTPHRKFVLRFGFPKRVAPYCFI